MSIGDCGISRCFRLIFGLVVLFLFAGAPAIVSAQDEDFDQYKVRVSGFWFLSSPTVTMEAAGHNGFVDFNRDFGFNNYSTFFGKFDWKFTRKNHFYFVAAPFIQSNQVTLSRTIVFRGQTFSASSVVKGELRAILYAPGYQYDIIRRKRGAPWTRCTDQSVRQHWNVECRRASYQWRSATSCRFSPSILARSDSGGRS
jgi:hypothetical protein